MRYLLSLVFGILLIMNPGKTDLNSIAEKYVRLSLATGIHDKDYVDAFYGPKEWKEEAQKQNLTLPEIQKQAKDVSTTLSKIEKPESEMERLRYEYLQNQLKSLRAFVDWKLGKKFSFDQESKALYDAVSPHLPEKHFADLLHQLESLLPGDGTLLSRYESFQKNFIIPRDKLDPVFQLALAESRKRTQQHIPLPPEESFVVEYVTDKPWSGYNWYQGNFKSVIQINTDLPIYIDRAVDLAGHEGYPGHHVYNVLLEQELLRKRNWVEFSLYPLFSSQSLIAEGSANYGVDILFQGNERVEFEKKVLFPAAGLDAASAPGYYKVQEVIDKLNYAGNEAARRLIDGEWTEQQAAEWLMKYGLYTKEKAVKRVDFIHRYRSYVINYNLGEDLVAKHIEKRSKTPEERWKALAELLGSPRLPSSL